MDWENERYVRVYTRDTADLLAARWEGRAVLWEMMRKADRAGIVEGDEDTLSELLRMPPELTRDGLSRLVTRGVVERGVIDGASCFVICNFIEAQEATQSDKQRQRESRARRRDRARAGNVTSCDDHSEQSVTPSDEKSRDSENWGGNVTPSLAVPSRAEPNQQTPLQLTAPSPPKLKIDPVIIELWDHFVATRDRAGVSGRTPERTKKRLKMIADRLKTFGPDELRSAVDVMLEPGGWYVRERRLDPKYVFGSTEQVEKHLAKAAPTKAITGPGSVPASYPLDYLKPRKR